MEGKELMSFLEAMATTPYQAEMGMTRYTAERKMTKFPAGMEQTQFFLPMVFAITVSLQYITLPMF
jgi:hypothetical protein